MIRSIHRVAEALNIKTVVEFVENIEILRTLKKAGVPYGQGMALGRTGELKGLIENFVKVNSLS